MNINGIGKAALLSLAKTEMQDNADKDNADKAILEEFEKNEANQDISGN